VAKAIGAVKLTPPVKLPQPDHLTGVTALAQPINTALALAGHTYADAQLPPGGEIAGKIFWQATAPITQSYHLQFSFVGPDRKRYVVAENLPLSASYAVEQWRKSEIVGQAYRFHLPAVAPPGEYPLQVTVIDPATGNQAGEPVTLAHITVEAVERNFVLPTDVAPISAVINNEMELVGYRLDDRTAPAGGTFGLTLYWRSLGFASGNYTVFVHAVGPDQTIRGQWDSVPAQGAAPTSGWVPGEIIEDHYNIPMTADAPPWEYDIFVGMYDPISGQRVSLFAPQAPMSENRVWLTRVQGVSE